MLVCALIQVWEKVQNSQSISGGSKCCKEQLGQLGETRPPVILSWARIQGGTGNEG